MLSNVKGMNDIWPVEMPYWQLIEHMAHKIFTNCGFGEIRTPILEQIELFQRSVGEATDIVQKEMFTLEDRKGRRLAMRPEGTAAVVRAMMQKGLDGNGEVLKYYYIGPMFRYERPQKGRLRQFHQLGAEIFGTTAPLADADLLESIWFFLETLQLKGVELQINSLGDSTCRPPFRNALLAFLKRHEKNLCADCQRRMQTNPLRVLDCKEEGCIKIVADAPMMIDYLCVACREHFETVKNLLNASKRNFTVNPRMARGLDYYNRTVFEFVAEGIGAKSAICGGGRYDDLIESLGGKPTAAIGFAIGIERLILLLEQIKPLQPVAPDFWVIYMGDKLADEAFKLATVLRREGFSCHFDYQSKSMKNQFGRASKANARFALIIGEDEIKNKEVTFKNLTTGQQQKFGRDQLQNHLKTLLGKS